MKLFPNHVLTGVHMVFRKSFSLSWVASLDFMAGKPDAVTLARTSLKPTYNFLNIYLINNFFLFLIFTHEFHEITIYISCKQCLFHLP